MIVLNRWSTVKVYILFFILSLSIRTVNTTEESSLHRSNDLNKPSTTKQCFVWFEVNNEKNLKKYLANVKQWNRVGNPIISARKNNVVNFTNKILSKNIPVISGFKTIDFFKKSSFYSLEAWSDIANLATTLSLLTKGRPVILENEGTMNYLRRSGIKTIDYQKLHFAISSQNWPEIWFWYSPMGNRDVVQSTSFTVAKSVINGIKNVSLIESNSSGYTYSKAKPLALNLYRTKVLDNNPVSIIYLDDKRNRFWKFKQITSSLNTAIGNRVIFYPGINDIFRHIDAEYYLDTKRCENQF